MPTREANRESPAIGYAFVGPSIRSEDVSDLAPSIALRPPICRGELIRAREEGGQFFLIVDGSFAHRLAISPSEVVDVIRDGATVIGASSMGAIRAAECFPAGMAGVGTIYHLFRLGLLESDDEVAVAMTPDAQYSAASVPLVNVRFAVRQALRQGLITRAEAKRGIASASAMFFPERTWRQIWVDANLDHAAERLRSVERVDIKRHDAVRAIARLSELAGASRSSVMQPRETVLSARPRRYSGHHRYFGAPIEDAKVDLAIWLFGSGRYTRFVWPLVVGEPELDEVGESLVAQRPGVARRRLVSALGRLIQEIDSLAERMWNELEYLDELDAELAMWHAVRCGARAAIAESVEPDEATDARVRAEIAISHGFDGWSSLCRHASDEKLMGAIPMNWVRDAHDVLVRARAYAATPGATANRGGD